MRYEGLDLNLLVALDALIRERNVTAAANSLNLSQPAMSSALARLRQHYKDELLVMRGRSLVLTPLAESLIQPTRDILLRVRATFGRRADFDPLHAKRTMKVVISDFMAIVFFKRVIDRVNKTAPGISFELLPFGDRPDELLREGEADFLIFPELFLTSEHPKTKLFDESLMCVVCKSNSGVGARLTIDQYIAMGHVAAQFGSTRKPSIEQWLLLKHGIARRIEVAVPHFSLIPQIVQGSNLIATMHRRLAIHFAAMLPLRVLPLPLPLPSFTEAVQWSVVSENDAASVWLRQVILDEAKIFRETTLLVKGERVAPR